MRFISGFAGTVVLLGVVAATPTLAGGYYAGNYQMPTQLVGYWGYGGYGGGYGGGGGGDNFVVPGGNTTVNSYYHYDARPRDGGFYGGNGVFYGDNGYSRVYYNRPGYGGEYCPPGNGYRPAQHIYDIGPAYRHSRHRGRY